MFASESILLNSTIACLESFKSASQWTPRDIIFTDKALYIFAKVEITGETADYLHEEYERLDMKNFRAYKPQLQDGALPPAYFQDLPHQVSSFNQMIELFNKDNKKKRLVSCQGKKHANQFLCLFNLVSSYRCYEQLFSSKSGPQFIENWVQTYNRHGGDMELNQEMLLEKNLPSLLAFARDNDSILTLAFSQEIQFGSSYGPLSTQQLIDHCHQILKYFNGESISRIKFESNNLNNEHFNQISQSLTFQPSLITLEIVYNNLGLAALDNLAKVVFLENRQLKNIILNNNIIGSDAREQDTMSIFLEAFLVELDQAEKLDLSYNHLTDQSLFPLVKYLFANVDCRIHDLNLEQNGFSNYAKRTIGQAYSRCSNSRLNLKFGPLPLTHATLKTVVLRTKEPGAPAAAQEDASKSVDVTIRRKPAWPEGLRYLPFGKSEREQIGNFVSQITRMCAKEERRKTFVEDIRDLCQQINDSPIEFPRHLMEPLYILVNDKLALAVHSNNIYTLEILLDCLAMMGARNYKAEERYSDLAQQAFQVGQNLMQCLNMDIQDDNLLLKMLVENLRIAKAIGMRGEVIDMAMTLKALCLKLLQEMLQKQSNSDDDDDPNQQPYLLREDDAACSVLDSRYDEFIDAGYDKLGLTSDVEPNLGLHPFSTDYIKITNLNLNYTRKNLTESRKLLLEEETYAFINIYTRCQFLLSDGEHDSSKSLAFSNARDDLQLRFTRLIFRYRLNLDECFEARVEPQALPQVESKRRSSRKPENTEDKGPPTPHSSKSNSQDFKRVEDYKMLNLGVSAQSLEYSDTPLKTPLSRVSSAQTQQALKFNTELYKIQESFRNKHREKECYRLIRGIFERFVIRESLQINTDLFDEFYLQLYRMTNHRHHENNSSKDNTHVMLIVLALLSRYIDASANLLELLEAWLNRKAKEQKLHERLITLILGHFKRKKFVESNEKVTDKLFVDWPPSLSEIESYNKDTRLSVHILWPTSEVQKYQVDESTTIETLLSDRLWRDKFLAKEPDKELYWLFSSATDELNKYPQPLSREKKILKLMYVQERDFEASESEGFAFAGDVSRKTTIAKKGRNTGLDRRSSIMGAVKSQSDFTLVLMLRKRLYSFLHTMQNFKALPLPSKNFLYHQIRYDYCERDILKRPILSFETATMLAALILKIKYQSKILRSKDNSLTEPIIKKNLDYVLPRSMKKERPQQSATWEVKILQCFEMENVKELSLEEAQDQFLTTLSNFEFMFGSYFVVERKPRVGFSSNFQAMQIGQGLLTQRKKMEPKMSNAKAMRKQSQRKGLSIDSDEYESSSEEETSQDQTDTIVSESSDAMSSRMALQESSKEHSKNLEIFDEYFGNLTSEILLIVKYNSILFLENRKRDKVLLEIKHTDLLYIMGKDDQLKIGLILSKRMGFAKETFDVGVELLAMNSRVIAEDVIGYCQLNLFEKCKSPDYMEFIKRNVIDIFNDDEGDGWKSKGDNNNLDLIVDDDLLMGIDKTIMDKNIAEKKSPLSRRGTITSMGPFGQESSLVSYDSDDPAAHLNQEDSMMNDSMNTSSIYNTRRLTNAEIHERKIARQLGFQFRFKQKDLLVYLKKHPVYTQSLSLDKTNAINSSVDDSKDSIGAGGRNKSAGETHSKLDAFKGLNEHTIDQIDEVSENSMKSEEMLGESSETSALLESNLSYSRLDREAMGMDKSLPKLSVTPPSPKDIESNIKDIPNLSAISAQKAEPFMSNRSIADHLRTDSLSPSPNNRSSHKVVLPGQHHSGHKSPRHDAPKHVPSSPRHSTQQPSTVPPVPPTGQPKVTPPPVPVSNMGSNAGGPPKPVERKTINTMDFMKKLQAMNTGSNPSQPEKTVPKPPPTIAVTNVCGPTAIQNTNKPNPLAIPKVPNVRPQDRFNLTQAIAFNGMNKADKKSELAKRMSGFKLPPPPPPS